MRKFALKRLAQVAVVVAASVIGGMQPVAAEAVSNKAELGINISLSRYYSPQIAFVDVFKHSRAWLPQLTDSGTWDTGDTLDLDENGWVRSLKSGQAAGTVMLTSMNGKYPAGQYICLYEGTGRITFGKDASIVSQTAGRIVLDVEPTDQGIYLKLMSTDSSDPVRNIRVIMPGHEATYESEPFYPLFVERLDGFKTLRYMRWGVNNSSYYTGWAGRATPEYYSQGTNKDVAIEYMIELSNLTQTDAWFSMPHKADDEYMREFAKLVKARLDPGLKAYIEYTNEVWNNMFPQASWAQQKGVELGLSSNSNTAKMMYYSKRAGEMFKIWTDVFAGETDRIVRVLGGMNANSWVAKTMLEFEDTAEYTDAVAIAPYFGGRLGKEDTEAETESMSLDELMIYLAEDIDRVLVNAADNKAVADDFGVDIIAYEGGQHLLPAASVRDNNAVVSLFIKANRDPRMADLYLDYMNKWNAMGGGMFVMFDNVTAFTKFGSWGIMEYQSQPLEEAHKLRALQEYMAGIEYTDLPMTCQ